MDGPLPDYRGDLIPAGWGRVVLTDALKEALAKDARRQCPRCGGRGYLSDKIGDYVCLCITSSKQGPEPRAT